MSDNYRLTPDQYKAMLIVSDDDMLVDVALAARKVPGVSWDIYPVATDKERAETLAALGQSAVEMNQANGSPTMNNPEEWVGRAEKVLDAGGYIVGLEVNSDDGMAKELVLQFFQRYRDLKDKTAAQPSRDQ